MLIKFVFAVSMLVCALSVIPSDGGSKYSDTAPGDQPPTDVTIAAHPVYTSTNESDQLLHVLAVSIDGDSSKNDIWLWDDQYSHGAVAEAQFQPDQANCPTDQGHYIDTIVFWRRSADLTVYEPERANATILHSVAWTSSQCYPNGYQLFVNMPGE